MRKLFIVTVFLSMAFTCSEKNEKPVQSKNLKSWEFTLLSPDFASNSRLPKEFTCDGADVSPALKWLNPPPNVKSFILTVNDPDAPMGNFKHWVVVDIPKNLDAISRNSVFPVPARALQNGFGKNAWGGPCPPSGTHRYIFTLYAVDLESYDSDKSSLDDFLARHTIKSASLTGLYKRGWF